MCIIKSEFPLLSACKKYWYSKEDDPYGLYDDCYGYDDYDFEWKPDEDAWEKYDNACKKAEEEFPKELAYDEIPCDYCKNMDCMNCKYINAF